MRSKQGAAFSGVPPLCPHDPIIIGRKTTKLGGVMHQMRYERIDWVGIEALSPKRARPVKW